MNDSPGTQRSRSEFTYHDVVDDDTSSVAFDGDVFPVLAGIEAGVATQQGSCVWHLTEKATALAMPLPAEEPPLKDHLPTYSPPEGRSTQIKDLDNLETHINECEDNILNEKENAPVETDFAPDLDEVSDASLLTQTSLGIDILTELQGKYNEDPFFWTILEKPSEFRNFEEQAQLVHLKNNNRQVLCVPKVLIQGRNAHEIIISEAHSMLAHLGPSRTLDYLQDQVWWKDMVTNVKAFCETCHTCRMSKPSNQKPFGLLNPLAIPSYPWESIGMDFVGPLPESRNRDGQYDSITVVICLLTAMVHLIPSQINYNATQLAELVFKHIY